MNTKVFFVALCLTAVCMGQGFPSRVSTRRTPTRIGNLLLTVSQPGARIYKGIELKTPLSGGPPEPVETGAFHWFDRKPGGGYAAIAYNAGADGYISRFAYRARKESLPPGAPEPPLPLPPPPSPPAPPPTFAPSPSSLDAARDEKIVPLAALRSDEYVPPSGVVQDASFDGDDEIDNRIGSALMASLV